MKQFHKSFFSPLFIPFYGLYGTSLILMVFTSMASLYPSYLYRNIYDKIIPQGNFSQLIWYGLFIVLVYIGTCAISVINNYIISYSNISLHNKLRIYLFKNIVHAQYRDLQKLGKGQILGRFQSDLAGIAMWFSMLTGAIASSVATFLTVASFIYILDYRLLLGVLPTLPLYIVMLMIFKDRIYKKTLDVQQHEASVLHRLDDFIHGLREIAISPCKMTFFKYLKIEQKGALKASLKMTIINSISNSLSGLVGVSGPTAMLVYGGYLVIQKEITVGTLIAFMTVIHRLYQSINSLFSVRLQHYSIKANIARIDELIDKIPYHKSDQQEDGVVCEDLLDGDIILSDICLKYGDRTILKKINCTIPMGSVCLISGPNGSGKSSLAEIIAGLQEPTKGEIAYGSKTINEFSTQQFRKNVIMAPQNPHVFNISIRENMAYTVDEVSDKNIRKIMDIVGLDGGSVGMELSDLDSLCGDNNILPSGGEASRIAIARALLCSPQVFILDESFSQLQENSRNRILDRIREEYGNITLIIVSHQVNEIKNYSVKITLDLTGKSTIEYTNFE